MEKCYIIQIPYENETLILKQDCYYKKSHIKYRRVKEILEIKYYWKGIGNNYIKYVKECLVCIKDKAGVPENQ